MKKIYNKLVRDNIPEIIRNSGKHCTYRVITDKKEFLLALADKLLEEAMEFKYALETNKNYLEELSDVSLVVATLENECVDDTNVVEVIAAEDRKNIVNGRFNNRIFLESVDD